MLTTDEIDALWLRAEAECDPVERPDVAPLTEEEESALREAIEDAR